MSALLSCFGCCGGSEETTPPNTTRKDEKKTTENKEQQQKSATSTIAQKTAATERETNVTVSNKPKVLIIYYSTYGHIKKLADHVKKGLEKSGSCDVELFQVPETLSEDILKKMGAPPKPNDPVLTFENHDKLVNADGLIFGFPTRFGAVCAQMKAFFDSLGHLWQKGSLNGKLASFFFSTGTQGGGQETTAWTAISQLAHLGLLYVPCGKMTTWKCIDITKLSIRLYFRVGNVFIGRTAWRFTLWTWNFCRS
jgi:NAD(P)H dehydrogenase (quinone)